MLQIYRRQLRRKVPSIGYPEGVGGREVCSPTASGRRDYDRRREAMMVRQNFLCAICRRLFLCVEFDHEAGRGSNGNHRDDRLFHEDGSWRNAALCTACNTWKASKRFKWIEGVYQEVVRQKFKEIA